MDIHLKVCVKIHANIHTKVHEKVCLNPHSITGHWLSWSAKDSYQNLPVFQHVCKPMEWMFSWSFVPRIMWTSTWVYLRCFVRGAPMTLVLSSSTSSASRSPPPCAHPPSPCVEIQNWLLPSTTTASAAERSYYSSRARLSASFLQARVDSCLSASCLLCIVKTAPEVKAWCY